MNALGDIDDKVCILKENQFCGTLLEAYIHILAMEMNDT